MIDHVYLAGDQHGKTETQECRTNAWIKGAKEDKSAPECGMYLFHNGIVRQSAKAKVRQGDISASDVKGMVFSYPSPCG